MDENECERAELFIDSMDEGERVAFIARLAYELTIAARSCWSSESSVTEKLSHLHEINELQHALATQIMSIADERQPRRPLAALFLGKTLRSAELKREVQRAFIDAIKAAIQRRESSS